VLDLWKRGKAVLHHNTQEYGGRESEAQAVLTQPSSSATKKVHHASAWDSSAQGSRMASCSSNPHRTSGFSTMEKPKRVQRVDSRQNQAFPQPTHHIHSATYKLYQAPTKITVFS